VSDARRDRWGRYLVLPPGGTKPIGYSRATTKAKILDDQGGLMPWAATATVVGALRRPGLQARWAALLAEHPDPWYGSPESKAACKRLVEECKQAGGSTDRADLGTAIHAIIEGIGRGGTPLLDDRMRADVDAYLDCLNRYGITVDPEMIESIVVLDAYQVAGTADTLRTTVPGLDDVVGDLKTGASLDYGAAGYAIQLAIYANADNRYMQGAAADGSEDRRLPMPNVSREHALLFHLPAGEARCTPIVINIDAGWDAFHRALEVEQWRKRKNLLTPLGDLLGSPSLVPIPPTAAASSEPPPFDAPVASAGADDSSPSAPAASTRGDELAAVPTATPDEGGPADDAAVALLRSRYAALDAAGRAWIGELWNQAQRHHVGFHLRDNYTVRRFELLRGLTLLCAAGADDDETLRTAVASVVGADWPRFGNVEPGHALGVLGADEAARFALLCDALAAGTATADVSDAGVVTLHIPN